MFGHYGIMLEDNAMTTDKEVWEAMTKEELIVCIMELDKDADDLSCENATYSDEADVRDHALSRIASAMDSYHKNYHNEPDKVLLVSLLDSISINLEYCETL